MKKVIIPSIAVCIIACVVVLACNVVKVVCKAMRYIIKMLMVCVR